MTNVVFAAPILSENAARIIRAGVDLDGVRLGVITQDPLDRLPDDLRARVAQQWRVDDVLNLDHLQWAIFNVSSRLGCVQRLFAAYEQLQVPIGMMRERLGIEGMGSEAARNFRDKARMKDLLRDNGLPCARHG